MPTPTLSRSDRLASLPFEDHLRKVLRGFRTALAEATVSVDADATRPQELGRCLGLDKSLAWHLSKILTGEDTLAIVPHLPGKAGMKIVVSSFEKAGASPQAVESLSKAITDYDRMVETHCGDRATLAMMLGNLRAGNGAGAHEEAQRKKLFEGTSAVWGVQARVQHSTHVVAPSHDQPDLLDNGIIIGLADLRRLRPDVPWPVTSLRRYSDDGSELPLGSFEPLDPAVGADAPPLLAEFCSDPLPELRKAPSGHGTTRYELVEGPVGNTAACTCVSAWLSRAFASPWRTQSDQYGEHLVNLNTPVKLLILDLFVHRDLPFKLPPQVCLYSNLPGGPTYPASGREHGRLPLRESVIELGSSPPDVTTPELPRYAKMVDRLFDGMGWSANDFVGYRLKLRYPPMPALALFRHELAERRD